MNKIARKIVSFTTLVLLTSLLPNNVVLAQNDLEIAPDSTHFLIPKFSEGAALLKNGDMGIGLLNYNILTEEMIFENEGKRVAIKEFDKIDTIYFKDRKFIPFGKVFYELAVEAALPLFIQHRGKVTSAGTQAGYGGTSQVASTSSISMIPGKGSVSYLKTVSDYDIINTTVYWIRKDSTFYPANNVRQFDKIMPRNAKEIKQFVKKEKTDFENPSDIIRLAIYINSL